MISTNVHDYRAIEPDIVLKITKDTSTLVVLIDEMVSWNNQTPTVASFQQKLFTRLITVAREITEKYCWLDLTQCTYQAYFELERYGLLNLFSSNVRLALPRSPILNISNISKIEFLNPDTNQWTAFDPGPALGADGLFTNSTERLERRGWSSVYFINPPAWAATINAYKCRITFSCGYDWPYTGNVALSYNSITGIVTATPTAPNFLNNNGMSATISSATHAGYNGTFPITVISNTQFTYQLVPSLTLPNDAGMYNSTPSSVFAAPETLILAIQNIVSYNYATRGDVPSMENLEGYPVPAGTRAILDQYAINRTVLGGDCL